MIVVEHPTTASPDAVWGPMSDVERWPRLTASVDAVECLTCGPLAVGSRYRISQPKMRPLVWEVTGIEPGRSFTTRSRNAGITTTAQHLVAPNGHGSLITLSIAHHGLLASVLARLTDRRTREYLRLEAQGVATAAEATRS